MDHRIVKDLCNDISGRAEQKAVKITKAYGNDLINFTPSINFCSLKANLPPSGYTMEINGSTPLKSEGIHPYKFFYGTSVHKLKSKIFTDNTVIDLRTIESRRKQLEERLNTLIKEETDNPLCFSNTTNYESALGGGGAYAGLYFSESRTPYGFENTYWIVVQSGAPTLSGEIFEKIEKLENERVDRSSLISGNSIGNSFSDFFFGNRPENAKNSRRLISNSRERLLYSVADALSIDVTLDKTPNSLGIGDILKHTYETFYYDISHRANSNVVTYHSQTVDIASKKSIVFGDNPFTGPIILEDVVCNNHLKNNVSHAFPVCTGRNLSISDATKYAVSMENKNVFIWEDMFKNTNHRLTKQLYNPLDKEFMKKTDRTGISFKDLKKIELRPILVKVCNS
jgi:hypothetical protein